MSLAHRPYVYVASSWRNQHLTGVITILRGIGAAAGLPEPHFGFHDFRDPDEGGFSWRDIDDDWENWDRVKYRHLLTTHRLADRGFERDMAALRRATAVLLVGPCGRSAHLELGMAIGMGKTTAVYLPESQEPELMLLAAGSILIDPVELCAWGEAQVGTSQPTTTDGKVVS